MDSGKPSSNFKLYSAPRRFDLATMMVVTLAYALLFAGMRLLRLEPAAMGTVAGFITCVGTAQALLFGGKRPRLSSMLVGAASMVGLYAFIALTKDRSLLQPQWYILLFWLQFVFAGCVVGYLAGIAVGTVFLVSDVIREFRRKEL